MSARTGPRRLTSQLSIIHNEKANVQYIADFRKTQAVLGIDNPSYRDLSSM